MRVKHSLLNISTGLANQLIITALSFVSRTVFIHSLGVEYLGINALFTSLLAMLSLAEAGIGSSIVYNLYKPVAEQNKPQILALMRLYKNAYRIIAVVVLLLGVAVFPFLPLIVKDTNVEQIELIYLIFLVNTSLPYLFIYKHAYLNVNQKNYIVTAAFSVSSIVSTCAKIAVLYWTENFLLYLLLEFVVSNTTTIWVAKFAERKYPFLKEKTTERLDPVTRASFVKNMKAILIANVGSYFVFGVESILISSFVSLIAVSLYANYKMLIDIGRTFLNQIFSSMYHSVGNLVAKENSEKVYEVFRAMHLLNFWLYSLAAIGIYIVTQPLIHVWLGSEFLLSDAILTFLVVMFFERGMRNTITTLKTTSGIFHEDRFAPLAQAAVNLGASLWLVHEFGLAGIFAGGLISAIAIPFWTTPLLVYRKVFHRPLRNYYYNLSMYTAIGLLAFAASKWVCGWLPQGGYSAIVAQGFAVVLVVNAIYLLFFYRTKEFKYLFGLAMPILRKALRIRVPVRARSLESGER